MKLLETTYMHDYIPPQTKRYDFVKIALQEQRKEKMKEVCACAEQFQVEPPKLIHEACKRAEWTGVAPMGRLIQARLIPAHLTPKQKKGFAKPGERDCFRDQPNRFLRILRTAYPDLYLRLRQMPHDELTRRIERDRLLSTYQIDFCYMNEYPEGIYSSLKFDGLALGEKPMRVQGPCDEFRRNIEMSGESGYRNRQLCEKAQSPFKMTFVSSMKTGASGDNSHWRAQIQRKRANFTEYQDTINKNGCVIMRNNLHDHSKCNNGKHCRHQLVHACKNLK